MSQQGKRVASQLQKLRHDSGITVEEMAKRLQVSESRIEALERGMDNDLRIGEIKGYAGATNQQIGVMLFGGTLTPTESVKCHAVTACQHLETMARQARNQEEREAFFEEGVFNIITMIAKSSESLGVGDFDVNITNGKNEILFRRTVHR